MNRDFLEALGNARAQVSMTRQASEAANEDARRMAADAQRKRDLDRARIIELATSSRQIASIALSKNVPHDISATFRFFSGGTHTSIMHTFQPLKVVEERLVVSGWKLMRSLGRDQTIKTLILSSEGKLVVCGQKAQSLAEVRQFMSTGSTEYGRLPDVQLGAVQYGFDFGTYINRIHLDTRGTEISTIQPIEVSDSLVPGEISNSLCTADGITRGLAEFVAKHALVI